jgi:hypothetical protein
MAREFTRNMLIMLVAIMVGIVLITYMAADVIRRSQIDTLTVEHSTEIRSINIKSENFTDHFLQGSVKLDSAREIREIGNYYFDFALFWYTNAVKNITENFIHRCIQNCTNASENYMRSYQRFGDSKPYFIEAKNFTNHSKYIEVLGYYVSFAQSGQNITLLRYNASNYLRAAAENLSLGNMANVSMLLGLFNQTAALYNSAAQQYQDQKDQIDGYIFFNEIREES